MLIIATVVWFWFLFEPTLNKTYLISSHLTSPRLTSPHSLHLTSSHLTSSHLISSYLSKGVPGGQLFMVYRNAKKMVTIPFTVSLKFKLCRHLGAVNILVLLLRQKCASQKCEFGRFRNTTFCEYRPRLKWNIAELVVVEHQWIRMEWTFSWLSSKRE